VFRKGVALAAVVLPFWLDVPFVRQEKEGCGAASVAMVLRYWKQEGDAREIHRRLYSAESRGAPARALIRYFDERGFDAFAVEGGWQDLEKHLAKGRPLIVCLKGRPRHYVVVVGVRPDQVALHDPAAGQLRVFPRGDFEERWAAAGRWTLLAVPRVIP
jgi:ABC-type bacteriocin/lantibiotic exporter with double-glycine peptidase domain